MVPLEHRKDFGRVLGVRPVIECQRDELRPVAGAAHDIGRRQAGIPFVVDQLGLADSGRREVQLARAFLRRRIDPQDLAVAFDVDVVGLCDAAKVGAFAMPVAPGLEHIPEAGILRAKPPQRDRPDAKAREHLHLVPAGSGVQHPHLMPVRRCCRILVRVVEIAEAGVAAGLVPRRDRAAVVRGQPCFLDGLHIGMVAMPIVGIVAERDDHLVRGQALELLCEMAREPAVRGDRPWLAALPVLVIGHQHDLVGHARQPLCRPFGIIDRHGHRHDAVSGREARVEIRHEALQRGDAGLREVLEVDHHAAIARPVERGIDLADQRRAPRRIFHDRGRAGAVPLCVCGVLEHRHHKGPVQGRG